MPRRPKKRLGRPPGTDSEETQRRIIETAQRFFGEQGYERATNAMIAEEVGLTSGSIYHYFGSKADLYVAVCDHAGRLILEHLDKAIAPRVGFVDKFVGVLEGAITIHRENPSLVLFINNAVVDAVHNPEVRPAVDRCLGGVTAFFTDLVRAGVDDGEIAPETSIESVVAVIQALGSGVAQFLATTPAAAHASMIREAERLIEGSWLIRKPVRRSRNGGDATDRKVRATGT